MPLEALFQPGSIAVIGASEKPTAGRRIVASRDRDRRPRRIHRDLGGLPGYESGKPHYLLHTRPGVLDRAVVARLRAHGIAVVGGLREGLSAIDRLARLAGRANS